MSVPAIRSDRAATASAVSDKALEAILATAEPTRLKILFLIGPRGRMCVGDIAARFKISRPAILHHLKVLKTYDLVDGARGTGDLLLRPDGRPGGHAPVAGRLARGLLRKGQHQVTVFLVVLVEPCKRLYTRTGRPPARPLSTPCGDV